MKQVTNHIPGTGRMSPFGNCVKLLVVLGMLLMTPGMQPALLAQAQATGPEDYESALERITATMELVQQLQGSLDRNRFDLEHLAFELGFEEPETIRDWIEENTAFQPYLGVLRGAAGTLVTGAGNSFDRSLLLSYLLNSAGYDTQLALGEFSEDDALSILGTARMAVDEGGWRESAERMLEQMSLLETTAELDYDGIVAALEEMLAPNQVDLAAYARAESTAGHVTEAISAQGISLGGELPDGLLAAASEHAWVEYRLGENDDWTPLPVGLPVGMELPEAHTTFADTIPSEHVHRIRIQAFAESKLGDDFETKPAMAAWEQPTATLNGVVVTYANVPSALGELGHDADIGTILDESDFFMPYIMDELAPGGLAFDLEGTLLEPAIASDQAAGVFRNVRSGFASALGALGAMGADDPEDVQEPVALTAYWLEYTLLGPGADERVHIRQYVDRVGAEERAAGGTDLNGDSREEAELALLREDRLMAITGDYRPDWVLDQFFSRFLDSAAFLEYALALRHGIETDITLEQALAAASPLEHLLASLAFDAGAQHAAAISYRAEPTVLVFGSGLSGTREDSVTLTSLDIMNNSRVTLAHTEGGLQVDAGSAVVQGVWETLLEDELQAVAALEAGVTRFSAMGAITAALEAGAELSVMAPGDSPEDFGLTGEAAVNARRDLAAGYHVLLPDSFAEPDRAAWWRVRADTGETLGVTFDGRGQTMLEYSIKLYDAGFSLLFAVKGLRDCERDFASGSTGQLCCLMKAHVNNVAGLGFGSLLGGGVAAATVGLGATMGSGILNFDFTGSATGLNCASFA